MSTEHRAGLEDSLRAHTVLGTHPPTLTEAAERLWPSHDEVRHGLAGQIAAATAGLLQLLGLAACWAAAHIFFATKTRAALFALVLVIGFAVYGVATHS